LSLSPHATRSLLLQSGGVVVVVMALAGIVFDIR
jgi:hypothetical protein